MPRIFCSPTIDICVVPRVELVYVSSEPVIFCVVFVLPSSWSNLSCKCLILVTNFRRLNPPALNRFLDCLYINRASSSSWAPLTMLSTYIECRSLSTRSLWDYSYFFRWYWIVAFDKNGLDVTPNTTWVNWNLHTSGLSLLILATHRNLTASVFSDIEIMRKVFSTSAVILILWVQNLCRMSKIRCSKLALWHKRATIVALWSNLLYKL